MYPGGSTSTYVGMKLLVIKMSVILNLLFACNANTLNGGLCHCESLEIII